MVIKMVSLFQCELNVIVSGQKQWREEMLNSSPNFTSASHTTAVSIWTISTF